MPERPRARRSRGPLALLLLLVLLVVAVVVADRVVVPRIADQRVRERVEPYGTVTRATARSSPNLRMIDEDPQRIDVRLSRVDLDALARETGSRATRETLRRLVDGGLRLTDARVRIRDPEVTATADADLDVLRDALGDVPGLAGELEVREDRLRFELSRPGLGALRTDVMASGGRVLARTRVVLGGRTLDAGVPTRTLLDDPGLRVERIGGRRTDDGTRLRVDGALR